ncbi:MAG: protein jag [Chloroflexi bacterium]|nr:protein jag [Chloroflexota bacterium]
MERVEMSGKSVDEAVELALRQLDASREEVEIEVLSPGKPGFLGFGSEPARVRVTRSAAGESLTKIAKQVVDEILTRLQVKASSSVGVPSPEAPSQPLIQIEGEDSGLLIGRGGETLRALQLLVNLLVAQRLPEQGPVNIDVEHYRERRYNALRELARRVADRVAATGRAITLEPMPANERRIIHLTLAEDRRVTTQSVDEGPGRKISVLPRPGGMPSHPRPSSSPNRGPRQWRGTQPGQPFLARPPDPKDIEQKDDA